MSIYTQERTKKNLSNVLNIERVFFSGNAKGKRKTKPACNWIKSLKQTQITRQSSKRDKHCARNPHSMLPWHTIPRQFKNRHCFFIPPSILFCVPPKSRTHQSNREHVRTKISLQPAQLMNPSPSIRTRERIPKKIKRSNSRTCQRTE